MPPWYCRASGATSGKAPIPAPSQYSLHPGPAQSVEDVIDAGAIFEQPLQGLVDEDEVWIELPQRVERSLRLLDPAELTEPGDDVAQPRRPVPIEPPSTSAYLHRFFVMLQLVVRTGERGSDAI